MKLRLFGLHESRGVASFIFWGRTDRAMEGAQEDKTGDQRAHKNVQETWLYIRAQPILLSRERREEKRKGEREN